MAVPEELQEQVLKEATSATPNFSTDYTDERFAQNDANINQQETEINHMYNGMIESTDKFYEDLKTNQDEWADKQAQIQQDNTDFAIEKIEQQKDQAQKDYIKEQSGAYVDWQKQSNEYGVNAEKMASAGLDKSGFSESSQVSMYNTYQNRVATARESVERTITEYNNNIAQAILQNNAALAQIYADAQTKKLELALQGFQYKNQLVESLVDKKMQLDNERWQRELAIMQQQNWEKQMAEEYRQFESNQKFTAEENQKNRDFQAEQAQIDRDFKAAEAQLDRDYEKVMEELKQLKYEADLKNQNATPITGSGGGASAGAYLGGSKTASNISNKSLTPTLKEVISNSNSFKGTTYKDAVAYMTKNGVPKSAASGIFTASEFSQRRASYSMSGQGSAAVQLCKSYPEYLSYITKYYMEQYKK